MPNKRTEYQNAMMSYIEQALGRKPHFTEYAADGRLRCKWVGVDAETLTNTLKFKSFKKVNPNIDITVCTFKPGKRYNTPYNFDGAIIHIPKEKDVKKLPPRKRTKYQQFTLKELQAFWDKKKPKADRVMHPTKILFASDDAHDTNLYIYWFQKLKAWHDSEFPLSRLETKAAEKLKRNYKNRNATLPLGVMCDWCEDHDLTVEFLKYPEAKKRKLRLHNDVLLITIPAEAK